jgi:hypothetical protein
MEGRMKKELNVLGHHHLDITWYCCHEAGEERKMVRLDLIVK